MARDSILTNMERRIDMDFLILKNELDNLFGKLNRPYGVIPEWSGPGVSEDDLKMVEKRLGLVLPESIKKASGEFCGIYHEAPYFMGDDFSEIQAEVIEKSRGELTEEDFCDNLEIQLIYSPLDWGNDEIKKLRSLNNEDLCQTRRSQRIAVGCDFSWLEDENFLMIGTTYAESLFMDLRDSDSDKKHGVLYNFISLHPFCVMYKIADDYGSFLLKIRDSLERKIQKKTIDMDEI